MAADDHDGTRADQVTTRERKKMGEENMSDDLTLTISSALHGERIWRRVGERPYTTRDGRPILLAVWETLCTVCGAPFEITTTTRVRSAEQTKRFQATTCPAHRMTHSEIMKLMSRRPAIRRNAFETIKAAKLATPSPTSGR
jgi:hypothetical protein